MSEDRDLWAEHRVVGVLATLHGQRPECRTSGLVALDAGVPIDEAVRALTRLEARGSVTSALIEVKGGGQVAWKLCASDGKTATGPEAEWPEMAEALHGADVEPEGVAGRLAREMTDPTALPGHWRLSDSEMTTAYLNVVDEISLMDESGEERAWQVATTPHKANFFLLTDIPHPEDPDEESVYELYVPDVFDELVEFLEERLAARPLP